jgi:hypothetical protein
MTPSRSALIVAHPGHELRIHHWLERARPLVFVLTDGSGSVGESRIASTMRVLAATGARRGTVFGRFSDHALYRAMMTGDVEPIAAATLEIVESLVSHDIDVVVADSCEFYNPGHDLCRVVANLAVERAGAARGKTIRNYDYSVTGSPDVHGADGEEMTVLDDASLQRKLDAAMLYPELKRDVESALRLYKPEAFRVEALRPVPADGAIPRPDGQPLYESTGEEHVAAGRFPTVLRHAGHFKPFVAALSAAVRAVTAVS